MQISQEPGPPSKRKRIITPARREQNRRAQRAYRQRRKEVFTATKQQTALNKQDSECTPAAAVAVSGGRLDMARTAPVPVSMSAMLTADHFFTPFSLEKETDEEEDVGDERTIAPEAPLYNNYTRLLVACVYNAATLGINVDEFSSYNCMSLCSPFYRSYIDMTDDPTSLLAAVSHSAIPVHLRPTLPQILFSHHPLFDLLPLPALRAKAITLAASAPSLFDLVEFKRDIVENGGIICSPASGSQPWDIHAWTIAPWFSKKWRLLSQVLKASDNPERISELT